MEFLLSCKKYLVSLLENTRLVTLCLGGILSTTNRAKLNNAIFQQDFYSGKTLSGQTPYHLAVTMWCWFVGFLI